MNTEIALSPDQAEHSVEYERAEKAIDETLKRLSLDYVDLLLLHQPYGNYLHAYKRTVGV